MARKLRDGRSTGPGGNRVGSGEGGAAKRAGPAGSIARASGKVGPQIVHSKGKRWTDAAEEIFLDRLAASNNATWAAKECGFSTEAIYARARRDPGFAGRMAAARFLAQGRIDEGLNRAAEDFLDGKAPAPDAPIVVTSVEEVIAIQKLNRPAQTGEGRRPAWPARPRTLDEVRGSILRKLSAIARKRGLI
jgi:hypothetical protein